MDDLSSTIGSCSNCDARFTLKEPSNLHGPRIPLLLVCGHAVCKKCLKTAFRMKGDLICGKCKVVSKQLKNNPEELNVGYPLHLHLLGSLTKNHSQHPIIEDSHIQFVPAGMNLKTAGFKTFPGQNKIPNLRSCDECPNIEAKWFCTKCQLNFCSKCFKEVHQYKSTKWHEKMEVSNVCNPPNAIITQSQDEKQMTECAIHLKRKLDFYCRDCNVCVCSHCIVPSDSEHHDHTVITVSKLNEEYESHLHEAVSVGNTTLINLQMALLTLHDKKALQGCENDGEKTMTIVNVAQQITNHFAYIHGILQQKEAALLKILSDVQIEEDNIKKNVRMEIRHGIDYTKNLLHYADLLMKKNDSGDSLHIVNLTNELLRLRDFPSQVIVENRETKVQFSAQNPFKVALDDVVLLKLPPAKQLKLINAGEVHQGWSIIVAENVPVAGASRAGLFKHSSQASSVSDLDSSELNLVPTAHPQVRGFIQPRTQEVVILCHIKDPSTFYVQRIPDAKFLNTILLRLQKAAPLQRPISNVDIVVGKIFLVEFTPDHRWYRGLILSYFQLDESQVSVQIIYLDYGNVEVVPIKRIRMLPPEFSAIPPLAIPCSLNEIFPRGKKWEEESIKWFVRVGNGVQLMCTVYDIKDGAHLIDLGQVPGDCKKPTPLSFRDALIFLGFGTLSLNLNKEVPINVSMLKTQSPIPCYFANLDFEMDAVEEVMVSHAESPSLFYVQKLGDCSMHLQNVTTGLTTFISLSSSHEPIYSPNIGMPCAARFSGDGNWYRAKIIAIIADKKVRVRYVDYGNQETLVYTNLRPLHEQFHSIHALAVPCGLIDVAPNNDVWSEEAISYFNEATLDKQLTMQVKFTNKTNPFGVIMFEVHPNVDICINSLLVRAGYAISTGPGARTNAEFFKSVDDSLSEEAKQLSIVAPNKLAIKVDETKLKMVEPIEEVSLFPSNSCEESEVVSKSTKELAKMKNASVRGTGAASNGITDSYRVEVEVVAAYSPDSLFVSMVAQLPLITNMMDEMQLAYKSSVPDDGEWICSGSRCAVFDSTTDIWRRGEIETLNVNGDEVTVVFHDVPGKKHVNRSDVRLLLDKFQLVRDSCLKCNLYGIVPAGGSKTGDWPKFTIQFVRDFFEAHKDVYITKKGIVENKSLPIELFAYVCYAPGPLEPTVHEWISLNKKLVEQGLAIPIRGSNEIPSISEDVILGQEELEETTCFGNGNIPLQNGAKPEDFDCIDSSDEEEMLFVDETCIQDWLPPAMVFSVAFGACPTYVDHTSCIFFQNLVQARVKVCEIQEKLQLKFADSEPSNDCIWAPDEMCIAKYHMDGNWYRAKTLELGADGDWKVSFVDYGNEETCTVEDLRKSDYLSNIPIQCNRCYIENLTSSSPDGQYSVEALDALHSLVVDQRCQFHLKSAIGSPDPIKVQIVRCDGVDIGVAMVNHGYAINSATAKLSRRLLNPISNVKNKNEESHYKSQKTSVFAHEIPPQLPKSKQCVEVEKNVTITHWAGEVDDDDDEDFEYCSMESSENEGEVKESSLLGKEKNLSNYCNASEFCTLDTSNINKAGPSKVQDLNGHESKTGSHTSNSHFHSISTNGESQSESSGDSDAELNSAESSDELVTGSPEPFIQLQELPLDDELQLIIKSVISPTEVLVFILTEDTESKLQELSALEATLQEEAPKQPQLYNPVVGMPCVILSANSIKWQRAMVKEIDAKKKTMMVRSIDHGYLEKLPFHCIVQLKPEWAALPATLYPCTLWGIKPTSDIPAKDITYNMAEILTDRDTNFVAYVKDRGPPLLVDIYEQDRLTQPYCNLVEAGLLLKTG